MFALENIILKLNCQDWLELLKKQKKWLNIEICFPVMVLLKVLFHTQISSFQKCFPDTEILVTVHLWQFQKLEHILFFCMPWIPSWWKNEYSRFLVCWCLGMEHLMAFIFFVHMFVFMIWGPDSRECKLIKWQQ